MTQTDTHLRRSRRCLQLHVQSTRYVCQHRRDGQRVAIQRVKVRAIQGDDKRRSKAGNRFFYALRQKSVDAKRHTRESAPPLAGEYFAYFAQHANLFRAVECTDLDFKFAVMRAKRIGAILGAPHPLRDGLYAVDGANGG